MLATLVSCCLYFYNLAPTWSSLIFIPRVGTYQRKRFHMKEQKQTGLLPCTPCPPRSITLNPLNKCQTDSHWSLRAVLKLNRFKVLREEKHWISPKSRIKLHDTFHNYKLSFNLPLPTKLKESKEQLKTRIFLNASNVWLLGLCDRICKYEKLSLYYWTWPGEYFMCYLH